MRERPKKTHIASLKNVNNKAIITHLYICGAANFIRRFQCEMFENKIRKIMKKIIIMETDKSSSKKIVELNGSKNKIINPTYFRSRRIHVTGKQLEKLVGRANSVK